MTCGVANKIASYVRVTTLARLVGTFYSKEWPILAYDKVTFSENGDSGALVVDARSQMGGMVTGGSKYSEKMDITYANAALIIA